MKSRGGDPNWGTLKIERKEEGGKGNLTEMTQIGKDTTRKKEWEGPCSGKAKSNM